MVYFRVKGLVMAKLIFSVIPYNTSSDLSRVCNISQNYDSYKISMKNIYNNLY